jgi:hypothetical protein
MKLRFMILLNLFVLLSFVTSPVSSVQAQTKTADVVSNCPPYDPTLIQAEGYLHSLPPGCLKYYRGLEQKKVEPATRDGVSSLPTGGPDGFGYTSDGTVPYDWIEATTNSGLVGDNEFAGPFDIGFNFPFYGILQSQLYFSTNGLITFGAGSFDRDRTDVVPYPLAPNNYIAPYWDDLLVGDYGNTGAIYYLKGGQAPNRYLVIEWHNVELFDRSRPFTFEAILYENGDIVFQYQSWPSDISCTIAIEDGAGYQGMDAWDSVGGLGIVRFYYPAAPVARLLVLPTEAGHFAALNAPTTDFALTVSNPGTLGTDTYDFSMDSGWPVTLYASDGTTPLTDTDGDTAIDTGPVAQGMSMMVKARFSVPGEAQIGSENHASITATSSLDISKTQAVDLYMSIPSGFASVFVGEDGAMTFLAAHPDGTNSYKAALDHSYGQDVAVTKLPTGSYLYVWTKSYYNGTSYVKDLEYALLDRNGTLVLPVTKLTDHSGEIDEISDSVPSIATTPNGTIGLVWTRYIHNVPTKLRNSNIYMATLTPSGGVLSGPTNITRNSIWSVSTVLNFYDPTIAGSDDDRFVLSWQRLNPSFQDIWYTVLDTNGGTVVPAAAVTTDGESWSPNVNSLTGGKVILTWSSMSSGPYYAILNSNGTFSGGGLLGNLGINFSTDAILLPNGKVAVVSVGDVGWQFYILSSSYVIESGPTLAPELFYMPWNDISVTTDDSGHVIMTWSGDGKQFYALGDDTGAIVTPPMPYVMSSSDLLYLIVNSQGNAPYQAGTPVDITVAGVSNTYSLIPTESQRLGYKSVNAGPVQVASPNPVLASQRVIYDGGSYSEIMGLPKEQLSKEYLFPHYNNVAMDSQLRVSNLGGTETTITVYLAGKQIDQYTLAPGSALRKNYPNKNGGPLRVTSSATNILATIRVLYNKNSYSELMGWPVNQLAKEYLFPYYNNMAMDSQLRVSNVGGADTTIKVYLGADPTPIDSYTLAAGGATRKNYANKNGGPLRVTSSASNILTTIRVLYAGSSFSELMGFPVDQLEKEYWYPVYDNATLNSQLRVSNVGAGPTIITVYAGGTQIDSYSLVAGAATRKTYPKNTGPLHVVSSTQPILTTVRTLYAGNSYSEMTGLPLGQLSTQYFFPWYNNYAMSSELRFAMP